MVSSPRKYRRLTRVHQWAITMSHRGSSKSPPSNERLERDYNQMSRHGIFIVFWHSLWHSKVSALLPHQQQAESGKSLSLQHLSCQNRRVPSSQAQSAWPIWVLQQRLDDPTGYRVYLCKSHQFFVNIKNNFQKFFLYIYFLNTQHLKTAQNSSFQQVLLFSLNLGEAVFFNIKL